MKNFYFKHIHCQSAKYTESTKSTNLKVMSKNMLSRVHESIAFCVSNRKKYYFYEVQLQAKIVAIFHKKVVHNRNYIELLHIFSIIFTFLIHGHEAILSLPYPIIPESFQKHIKEFVFLYLVYY